MSGQSDRDLPGACALPPLLPATMTYDSQNITACLRFEYIALSHMNNFWQMQSISCCSSSTFSLSQRTWLTDMTDGLSSKARTNNEHQHWQHWIFDLRRNSVGPLFFRTWCIYNRTACVYFWTAYVTCIFVIILLLLLIHLITFYFSNIGATCFHQ